MVHKEKDLTELCISDIYDKLNEIHSILSLSRDFSIKVDTHLKIMSHLINMLIPSDDSLTLIDRPITAYIGKNERYSTSITNDQNIQYDYSIRHDEMINVLIDNYNQENKKLWVHIANGQNNIDFVKSQFKHLFEGPYKREIGSYKKYNGITQKNNNNINTCPLSLSNNKASGTRNDVSERYIDSYKANENINTNKKISYKVYHNFDQTNHQNAIKIFDMKKTNQRVYEDKYDNKNICLIEKLTEDIQTLKDDKEISKQMFADTRKEIASLKIKHKSEIDEKDKVIQKLVSQLQTLDNQVKIMDEEVNNLVKSRILLDKDARVMLEYVLRQSADLKEAKPINTLPKESVTNNETFNNGNNKHNIELERRLRELEIELKDKNQLAIDKTDCDKRIIRLMQELKELRDENINLIKFLHTRGAQQLSVKMSLQKLPNMPTNDTVLLTHKHSSSMLTNTETPCCYKK